MVSNNVLCEMTTEELMVVDGGGFWDSLAEGFGNAFGVKNVTADEVVTAASQMVTESIMRIRNIFK